MSADTRSVLSRLIMHLDSVGIPYMVAGSFASTYHGVPRTTNDIDIVISPNRDTLNKFLKNLPESDYYVSHDAALDALQRRTMFNVIDMETGWKVDLIIRKTRVYSVEEFNRRIAAQLFDVPVFIATAEDTIVTKIEWSLLSGGSEQQLRDAFGILSVKGEQIDRAYIQRWVDELGIREGWSRLNLLEDPGTR